MSDEKLTAGQEPRNGYSGRGETGSHLDPQLDAKAKFEGDMPTTYPQETTPRPGFAARMGSDDNLSPDVPAPNVVTPKPWNENSKPRTENPL